ncbi:MAG: glutathione S-transferase family protein [Deltaproteobacteria bacterium]|nr:glutathione S-transferase family protein [Deltaproteobacteria bacterium]
MKTAVLYQFELCPFCHKVKAALEVKGIPFRKIEVNPMTKKELPELEGNGRRKVPVLEMDGTLVADSTEILKFLETKDATLTLEGSAREKSEMIEAWVDDDLAQLLPAVIYGTWRDAARAARVVARTSNFGFLQNAIVRGGGSIIMNRVAKKILARRGGGNPTELLATELDKFESWLGEQDFVCGDTLSLGDVAVHGCLTCIQDFPAFKTIMERERVAAWFERVRILRENARAPVQEDAASAAS